MQSGQEVGKEGFRGVTDGLACAEPKASVRQELPYFGKWAHRCFFPFIAAYGMMIVWVVTMN